MNIFTEVFGKVTPHKQKIGDKELSFYPISPKLLKELKALSIPVSEAIASIMMKPETMAGIEQESYTNTKSAEVVNKTNSPALSVDAGLFIHQRRRDAMRVIMEFFCDEVNHQLLAKIIMNSLKDDFPNRNPPPKELEAFLEACDLKSLVELIKGVVSAHKDLLGPFIEPLKGAFKDLNLVSNPTPENIPSGN